MFFKNLSRFLNISVIFREFLKNLLSYLFDYEKSENLNEYLAPKIKEFLHWILFCLLNGLFLNFVLTTLFGAKFDLIISFALGSAVWYLVSFKERLFK